MSNYRFLDLSTVFDTIDHKNVVYLSYYLSFGDNALNLMKSYLSDTYITYIIYPCHILGPPIYLYIGAYLTCNLHYLPHHQSKYFATTRKMSFYTLNLDSIY